MSQQDDRTICATKFRAMLSCVEKTGTVTCTEKINDFLSCERAVLRKALSKPPPLSAPAPSSQHDHHRIPTRRPVPTPTQNLNTRHDDADVTTPGSVLSRVVEKQIAACTRLTESVRKPEFMPGVWSFSRRMVADIRVTFSAIGVKLGKVVNDIRDRFEDD